MTPSREGVTPLPRPVILVTWTAPTRTTSADALRGAGGGRAEPLRRFLARRTDPETADDVLAETLLVCWRRLRRRARRRRALPWAYGVARNASPTPSAAARRQRRVAAPDRAPSTRPEVPDPGAGAATTRLHEALAGCGARTPSCSGCGRGSSCARRDRDRPRRDPQRGEHPAAPGPAASCADELGKIEAGAGHEESEEVAG